MHSIEISTFELGFPIATPVDQELAMIGDEAKEIYILLSGWGVDRTALMAVVRQRVGASYL